VSEMRTKRTRSAPAHAGTEPSIVHVTKIPPSPSGVALYATVFRRVLETLGEITVLPASPTPRSTQSLSAAVRGLALGLRFRKRPVRLVHVELSGRGLFEFFFLVGLTFRERATRVAVTCHDAPSLAGQVFLFAGLDRKGLRRLGALASRHAGRPLERRVLRRSDAVLVLTRLGAEELESIYGVPVSYMPHISYPCDPPPSKDRLIFVPGYFDRAEPVLRILRDVVYDSDWKLAFGACSSGTRSEIEVEARRLGLAERVESAGFVSEANLLAFFARASVVVRVCGRGDEAGRLAASGPLIWAASFGCLTATDDPRAGARELASIGLTVQSNDLAGALVLLVPSAEDPSEVRSRIDAATRYCGYDAVWSAYCRALGFAPDELTKPDEAASPRVRGLSA
jgi:Glycosyl transferase 4-like domain